MTPIVLYNVLPTIGNALVLLVDIKGLRREFANYGQKESSLEKTVYFVTSSIFLQIGSQYLGYQAAMAWCGLTVTPIMVATAYVATITAIAIIALGIAQRPLKDEIIFQSVRAIVTFGFSFFLNRTLLGSYGGYQIARSVALAKTDESMKAILQSTKSVTNSATARAIYMSNMSMLGYSKSYLTYLETLWALPTGIWIFNLIQIFRTQKVLRRN